MPLWQVIALVAAAVLMTAAASRAFFTRRAERKVRYMLDALEDGETNFRFHEGRRAPSMNRTLNRIKSLYDKGLQEVTEENEVQSWTRLFRVLTHEIMNTVTPIATLSEALTDPAVPPEDLHAGLETIAASSRGLIRFVESYRNLTKVPMPVKKAFFVRDMVEKVINLNRLQYPDTVLAYREQPGDILLYADEGQVSRILINLTRNAVQAGAARVEIAAEIDPQEHVNLYVSNDGAPIPPEEQDQVFVPFYTTKAGGSGIGLSVSRQIMRLNGGSIRLLRSNVSSTVFLLSFR